MNDLISKDKVLRCLKESSKQIDWGQSEDGDAFKHYVGANYRTIAEFEPEQFEQKHGHWIFDPNGMDWNIPAWCCSECHCRNDNIPPNMEKVNPLRWSGSKFCPNCGAVMDEEVKQKYEQN